MATPPCFHNRTRAFRRPARTAAATAMFAMLSLMTIMTLTAPPASAQSIGKVLGRWEMGFGVERVNIEEESVFNNQVVPGRAHREKAYTMSTSFMWNVPVYALSEDLAIGVSPAIALVLGPPVSSPDALGFGTTPDNTTAGDATGFSIAVVNLPVLAMINYGTDATMKREKHSFGAGLGIGYQESWLFTSSFFYGMPILAADVGYYGTQGFKLRCTIPLVPYHVLDHVTVAHYNLSLYFTF
jgi:hypothetical protein